MVLEELLAPAGSPEVLTIAVNAGADAVCYCRANMVPEHTLKTSASKKLKAVNYAHMNAWQIHVTVNTLVNNFEISTF